MTKLTDTQRVLLAGAAQRDSGSLLPLPTTLKASGGAAKAITALISRGLAEEHETSDVVTTRRSDGDVRYGAFITAAGAEAIGIEPQPADEAAIAQPSKPVAKSRPNGDAAGSKVTKAASVITLLSRPSGATLAELIEATGWLPHTTRAALTGLRKKGYDVARDKREGTTCYRIVSAA